MRIRLSPQENRLVAQVIGVMEKVGYTEKRVKDQKATLRGTLRRGYAVLRTPEGRSSCVTLPSTYGGRKGRHKTLAMIAQVYGVNATLHLSRKGEVSLHQYIPPEAVWPEIGTLLLGFDETKAVEELTAQRREKLHPGAGRPPKQTTLNEAIAALQAAMRAVGIEEMTVRASGGARAESPLPPGERLKAWREALGLSQEKLGSMLGYALGAVRGRTSRSCTMLSHIERGKHRPGPRVREKIETLAGIPAGDWKKIGGLPYTDE